MCSVTLLCKPLPVKELSIKFKRLTLYSLVYELSECGMSVVSAVIYDETYWWRVRK